MDDARIAEIKARLEAYSDSSKVLTFHLHAPADIRALLDRVVELEMQESRCAEQYDNAATQLSALRTGLKNVRAALGEDEAPMSELPGVVTALAAKLAEAERDVENYRRAAFTNGNERDAANTLMAKLESLARRQHEMLLKEGGCDSTWCHECFKAPYPVEEDCDKYAMLEEGRKTLEVE